MIPVNNIFHRFEVTIVDEPLNEIEILLLHGAMDEKKDIDMSISESGRIILFSGLIDIRACVKLLAELGFAEDVGLIREITEYWPVFNDGELQPDLFERDN